MIRFLLLLALFGYSSAAIVGGRRTYINYNSDCGVWNDRGANAGKILEECCPVDATYPGTPWQQLSVSYNAGAQQFKGNTGAGGCPSYSVLSEKVLDDGSGKVGISHVMKMGLLQVNKTEVWEFDGKILHISFKVKYVKDYANQTCKPISDFTVMHGVDPDQDRNPFLTFQTINDVIYNGGNGLFAEAVGPQSCQTLGYGICSNRQLDGSTDQVGFTHWQTDANALLVDPSGSLQDNTMHYQHKDTRPLYPGDEREFSFFVVSGRCDDEARRNFLAAHAQFCRPCYRLPRLSRPPTPRCAGRCPCTRKDSCNCTYTCRRRAAPILSDVTSAKVESEELMAKCDGSRVATTTLRSASDNAKSFKPASGECRELEGLSARLTAAKSVLERAEEPLELVVDDRSILRSRVP